MSILQGSTYKLPVIIRDSSGKEIDDTMVSEASFTFGNINKVYKDEGDVYFDPNLKAWIVPLSEEETFGLKGIVDWQARFYFNDGTVDGTLPKSENVYSSIDQTRFTGGVENA